MSIKNDNRKAVKHFFKSPEFAMIILTVIILVSVCCYAAKNLNKNEVSVLPSDGTQTAAETTETSEITTTSAKASETTVTSEVTSAEVTTAVSEIVTEETEPVTEAASDSSQGSAAENSAPSEPFVNLSPYMNMDESPNRDLYQQKIMVAGDSVAYGFNAHNYISDDRNFAQGSVSMWNMDAFTFDSGLSMVDAVSAARPELLYISVGMNDVNMDGAEQYASRYTEVVRQISENCPDTVIVAAGITPTGAYSYFTSNSTIREFNSALKSAMESFGKGNILYFDAYSVLCDSSLDLRYECDGGDGIHLQAHSYDYLLKALSNFLDEHKINERFN